MFHVKRNIGIYDLHKHFLSQYQYKLYPTQKLLTLNLVKNRKKNCLKEAFYLKFLT